MKKLLTALLLFVTANSWAVGFSNNIGFRQPTFYDSPTFSYPNSYSSAISITFTLPATNPASKLFVREDTVQSFEDPNQQARLYVDPALTIPLASQPIDVSSYGDGQAHSIELYAKYYSVSGNAISRAGNFTFQVPIYVTDDSEEYSANVELTPTVEGSCGFLQATYNVNSNIAPGQSARASTNVTFNCSPGLTPSMTTDTAIHRSNEDSSMTMKIFGDSSYTSNIYQQPLELQADGTNKTQTLFFQYFENGSPTIMKAGLFTFASTIIINF